MKVISLVKFFTLVGFLVLVVRAQAAEVEDTKDACKKKVVKEKTSEIKAACENGFTNITDKDGKVTDRVRFQPNEVRDCVSKAISAEINTECGELKTDKEIKTECKQALKEYDDAATKMKKECGSVVPSFGSGSSSIKNDECRQTAEKCKSGLGAFGSDGDDSESVASASVNLFRVVGQMQSANNGGDFNAMNGCLINKDKAGKTEVERIDDKITQLREQMAGLKEKMADADNDFNEKKQKADKEMLEIEEEAAKETLNKQTENQKEVGRIQKSIMASEKKKKDNIIRIADIHPQIAKLAFDQQELVISLSDSGVSIVCRAKATDEFKKKTGSSVDPKTGKTVKPKFSLKESSQVQKEVKFLETQCLQAAALERQRKAKGIIDQKRKLESTIVNLESENADETKAIENEIKQMEELKKISDEGEAKAIEAKSKKLNSLNTSVIEMDRYTAEKKRSYDEKSKALQDKIDKVRQDRLDVSDKFNEVSAAADEGGRAASRFVSQCCKNSDPSENHKECGRVISSDPDVTEGGKAYKKSTKKIKSGTSN